MGPIFYDGNMNGEKYQNLIEDVINNLDDVDIIWQQDGAPCHNTIATTNYFNEQFPEWMGRFGTIHWPPNSPDLTVMDSFFWGYLKGKFDREVELTVPRVKDIITNEIATLNGEKQGFILAAIERQKRIFRKCLEMNGGHVENLKI